MKRFIIFLLFAGMVIIGCKGKPKEMLVNKWRITDMTMPGQTMPDSVKGNIAKGTMEFTKDGRILLTGMGKGADQAGTYTLSDDGKILTVVTNGRSEVNDVTELSKSKLVIVDKLNGGTLTAVPK